MTAPPAPRTLRGLDWLNFFLADVQTGVGPFLAIYLAGHGWNEQHVGLALTVGGIRSPSSRWRRVRCSSPTCRTSGRSCSPRS
ncbi:MAG: hypothetical protein NTV97_35675 [Alphaproteobacteria bacterium]|nr:hypothetical protein [Alphaproteobacteria bacterium]